MPDQPRFTLSLDRRERYQFDTTFDWEGVATLLIDEPKPLGDSMGPNAARLVGAAVGNCLSASLLFCLEKAKQTVNAVHTEVVGTMIRNDRGRLRIGKLDVRITLDITVEQPERVTRCFDLFEDYCVVTGSIRKALPVSVTIMDPNGMELYRHAGESGTDS